jgi:SAM-dependent methyltransferase
MCSPYCIAFGTDNLSESDIKGKRILEVGLFNVNGSLRNHCLTLNPKKYLGVDLSEGPCVDVVLSATELVNTYGKNSFDVVISTEMLEHVVEWKPVITNMKQVLKPGGIILITTRSQGFPFHEWPVDAWRFSVEDMHSIFSDFEIDSVIPDPYEPGVFIRARKPVKGWVEKDLSEVKLYSIPAADYV